MADYPPADLARVANTIVRTCTLGHPLVTYYARRDEPEPPCPTCGRTQGPPPKETKETP